MPGMLLIRPYPVSFTAAGSGVTNLGTPSPREVWVSAAAGAASIEVDLGSNVQFDSFMLANTNAQPTATWKIDAIGTLGGQVDAALVPVRPLRLNGNIRPRFPAFSRLPEPVTARFLRFTFEQPVAALEIGALIVGKALDLPYAFGSGRTPIDTSRVVSLQDGGFGIDRGVVKAALQWRFIDLGNESLNELWALAENRGESLPLVVVEGPDYPPAATSVHYGLFRRFEAFDREDPAATKWALSIEEWR